MFTIPVVTLVFLFTALALVSFQAATVARATSDKLDGNLPTSLDEGTLTLQLHRSGRTASIAFAAMLTVGLVLTSTLEANLS